MIIETIMGITILILCYVIWNLYSKVDFLEQALDGTYVSIGAALQNMRDIDSLGSFEADDEAGTTFTELLNQVEILENLIGERNDAA